MLSSQAEAVFDVSDFEEKDSCLGSLELLSDKKPTVECRCPKCGKTHFLTFLWTGRGKPRKYCHRCREVIAGINSQCIYEASPDAYRVNRGGAGTLE